MSALADKTDAWIWALVIGATASVVALGVVQGRRSEARLAAQAPPEISLPLLGGGNASISHGKVTVVDFWATWCVPCRASMPRVQRLWQEYKPAGVEIYSVDTDDPSADRDAQVREFLAGNRLTFPVVLDDGRASQAFGVASIPTMVVLDKQGRIAWSHVGALDALREVELRAALDGALGR